MRKVLFKVYVRIEYHELTEEQKKQGIRQKERVEGTGCFSDYKEGEFMAWGLDADDGASYTVGVIRDVDGQCHLVTVDNFKFL